MAFFFFFNHLGFKSFGDSRLKVGLPVPPGNFYRGLYSANASCRSPSPNRGRGHF